MRLFRTLADVRSQVEHPDDGFRDNAVLGRIRRELPPTTRNLPNQSFPDTLEEPFCTFGFCALYWLQLRGINWCGKDL